MKKRRIIKLESETRRSAGRGGKSVQRDTQGQFVAVAALAEALLLRIGRERNK